MPVNFPDDTQRLTIVGATGTGKTTAGLWHVSHRDFHLQPWLIYNFKRDKHIDGIPYASHIGVRELPSSAGIYIVHPTPEEISDGLVENQMRHIWERERIGVFVDEVYMIGNRSQWFRALLTQGRSKRIPMIICSQRPVYMDVFALSESEFFQVYFLNLDRDRRTVEEFVPVNLDRIQPPFWSRYYDVAARQLTPFRPVPKIEVIHATFERRLRKRSVAV